MVNPARSSGSARLAALQPKIKRQLRLLYCLHFAYYNFCRIHRIVRVTPGSGDHRSRVGFVGAINIDTVGGNALTLAWEDIYMGPGNACRSKVPGGWFVKWELGGGSGIFFFPDRDHSWDGNSLE